MRLDFLVVADRAEATGGKLYLLGGGWDRVGLSQFPGAANFDVAIGILVGYNETNEPHEFQLVLEDDDNRPIVGPVGGQFEMGRPPGVKLGQSQRFIVAVRGPFPIQTPGAYHWAVSLDGQRVGQTDFWVDSVPPPAVQGT